MKINNSQVKNGTKKIIIINKKEKNISVVSSGHTLHQKEKEQKRNAYETYLALHMLVVDSCG